MGHALFRASRGAVGWASEHARRRRMRVFCRLMSVHEGLSILDLGGSPEIWRHVPGRLRITLLNRPGSTREGVASPHDLSFLEGDACRVPSLRDRSFDLVFSNSVIEHVGAEARRAAFAAEVRRLGRSYWVQTPSKWFPIEAHTAMPFWWFYPRPLRESFVRRWHRALPAWADAVAETSVLTREELLALFPEASLYVETVLGIPKSYVAYSRDAPS